MPPKSKKDREDRLTKQRLCQRRRYAEINNDPELLAIEKEKRRQKYLKKKAESNTGKSPSAIKEQRKRWKENSKRYRQKKNKEKQPNYNAISVKVAADESESSSSEINLVNKEDPLKVNNAADRQANKKVKYEEFKKRKQLLRLILCLKEKNKAHVKKIQRLQKQLKFSRQKNNSLSTYSNETVDSELSTCTVTAGAENSSGSSKSSVIETIKNFYLQDANGVQCADNIVLQSDSNSHKENYVNIGNTNLIATESEDTFSEHVNHHTAKKKTVDDDEVTLCSSPCKIESPETEYNQDAQRWEDYHYSNNVSKPVDPLTSKQFSDAAVMTEEIDDNTRISNLMFSKFIARELDKYNGNDDERYDVMQRLIEVLKKRNQNK